MSHASSPPHHESRESSAPFYHVLGMTNEKQQQQEARLVGTRRSDDGLNSLRTLMTTNALFRVQPGIEHPPTASDSSALSSPLGIHYGTGGTVLGPRGLLLSDSLPSSPAHSSLERKPRKSPQHMFSSIHSWPLRAARVLQDDPALLVQNNQEKLLNSSIKKQVLSHSNHQDKDKGKDKDAATDNLVESLLSSNAPPSSQQQEHDQQDAEDLCLLSTLIDSFSLDLCLDTHHLPGLLPPKKGSSPGPGGTTGAIDSGSQSSSLSDLLRTKLAVPPNVSYTFADSLTGQASTASLSCSDSLVRENESAGLVLPWRQDFLPAICMPDSSALSQPSPLPPPPGLIAPPDSTPEQQQLERPSPITSPVNLDVVSSSSLSSGGGAPVRFSAFRPKYNLEDILNEEEEEVGEEGRASVVVGGFVTEQDEADMLVMKDFRTASSASARSLPHPHPQRDVDVLEHSDNSDHASSVGGHGDEQSLSIDDLLADSNTEYSLSRMTAVPSSSSSGSSGSGDGHKWASTEALPDSEYEALRPHLAMTHPFELDFFQKQAVMRLERRECVFVAAHTSAGKTVVAEYAIAMAKKHMSRTIYTSPIKALSNQKYRDFVEKFGADVGLITGDMSINPDASCLIMTTEILRSMLYRGSDTIRDIEWVIFDEVHYVNDAERGVVWEEVIIMLPERINLIFLSATTPNTIEFSDWIGRTKQRKVYVTSTSKRPVPLQHFFFHDDEVYPLMTPDGRFQPSALQAAVARVKQKAMIKEKTPENAAMGMQRQMEKAAIAAQNRGSSVSKGGRGGNKGGGGGNKGGGGKGGGAAAGGRGGGGKGGGGPVSGGKAQWLSLIRLLFNGGRLEAGGLAAVDFGGASAIRKGKSSSGKMGSIGGSKKQQEKYDRLPDYIKEQVTRKEYAQMDIRMETSLPSSSADFHDEYSSVADDETEVGLLPVVVFCFSKKKCEEIIDFLKSMDFLSAKEKAEVKKLMAQVINRLNPDDARLPQITRMTDLLTRGLAVHHGGLLPVLKEAVEILFSKSLVRVLIATETFAMGVNMPARAVVFNGYRKHDGKGFRDLLPGEYTQMAGRAGRRGKDTVGTVVIANFSEIPPHAEVGFKTLLTGTATKLTSQFRLSYNMILNLLRVNDLSVEDMIKRSFSEFHMQRHMAKHDLGSKLQQLQSAVVLLEQRKEFGRLQLQEQQMKGNVNISEDVEAFYAKYQATTTLLSAQLSFAMSIMRGGNSDCVRDLLGPGRFLLVHQVPISSSSASKIAAPCLGIVLSDPLGSFSGDEKLAKAETTSAGKSKGLGNMGLGLEAAKGKLGIGGGTCSSNSASDDQLAQRPLSDLYVWVLVLVPRTTSSPSSGTVECRSSAVHRVSLEHISMLFEAKAPSQSVSSSAHLLGLSPPPCETPSPVPSSSLSSSSFGGMKMKMKMKGDDDDMFGMKSKGQKKGGKATSTSTQVSSSSSGNSSRVGSGSALSGKDCRAALLLQLFDFVHDLPTATVLDVSSAIKHREFEFAESCLKHGLKAREILTQFKCWQHYLGSFFQQQTDTQEGGEAREYMQQQEQFVASFLLEHRIFSAKEKIHLLQHYASSASLALFPDFQQRMRVLEHLGYIDRPQLQHLGEEWEGGQGDDLASSTVSLKGRVACEMNTCDELLATEVLFMNILEPLNPPEIAALLSAFVFQEKNNEECELTSRLEVARAQVNELHSKLQGLQESLGVEMLDSGQGKTGVNFGLAAVVYEWARGRSFMSITGMTLTHEGSVVRTMTRLDELCTDFRNAARVVGNPSLYRKMEATSQCIKRDIVFAASLYVS